MPMSVMKMLSYASFRSQNLHFNHCQHQTWPLFTSTGCCTCMLHTCTVMSAVPVQLLELLLAYQSLCTAAGQPETTSLGLNLAAVALLVLTPVSFRCCCFGPKQPNLASPQSSCSRCRLKNVSETLTSLQQTSSGMSLIG